MKTDAWTFNVRPDGSGDGSGDVLGADAWRALTWRVAVSGTVPHRRGRQWFAGARTAYGRQTTSHRFVEDARAITPADLASDGCPWYIEQVTQMTPIGGRRRLLRCPVCAHARKNLYVHQDGPRCRRCAGLRYQSEYVDRRLAAHPDRAMEMLLHSRSQRQRARALDALALYTARQTRARMVAQRAARAWLARQERNLARTHRRLARWQRQGATACERNQAREEERHWQYEMRRTSARFRDAQRRWQTARLLYGPPPKRTARHHQDARAA